MRESKFRTFLSTLIPIGALLILLASCNPNGPVLCKVNLGASTSTSSKSIMAMLYGPVDYSNLDIDSYGIYYWAAPSDGNTSAYGSTEGSYKRLSSSQDSFVLSQGTWDIRVHLMPKDVVSAQLTEDEIVSKGPILSGELESVYVNLNTRTLVIPCSFPTVGKGDLYLAYSTPIFAKTDETTNITYSNATNNNTTADSSSNQYYTTDKGTISYKEKTVDVTLWKLTEDSDFVPLCVYYPDRMISYNTNGDPVTTKGEYLTARDNGVSRVWQFTGDDHLMELDTGFYVLAVCDLNSEVIANVEAKKYYNRSVKKPYTYTAVSPEKVVISELSRSLEYLESVYGETLVVYVAPGMTTIVKGNSEYALDVETVNKDTSSINHNCDTADIHYYVNQYGAYCAYCLKGNAQAKEASITDHQYFYKRSDGVYCVVDIPSIPLSPESQDSATKLIYAWIGYEGAKKTAQEDYAAGGYRLCTYDSVHGYTSFKNDSGSYLRNGQFFFFLNFDGTVASFHDGFDESVEAFSRRESFYNDTAAGVFYPYIHSSRRLDTNYIYGTSDTSVSSNLETCVNSKGIYEYTVSSLPVDDKSYTYNINAVKRALEAGQKYCIMYINRQYTTTAGQSSGENTGRTLVSLNYKSSLEVIEKKKQEDTEFVLYDDIHQVSSGSDSDDVTRAFVWQATADWEVYSLLNHFNGAVSNRNATDGVGMTSFAKTGSGRKVGFTFFMAGTEGAAAKAAGLSNPRKDNANQRWEFFVDCNRDVILTGKNTNHPYATRKFAILFGRPYYLNYDDPNNFWGDRSATATLVKDGRYIAVFSPLITSYVAGAHGKNAYTLGASGLTALAVKTPNETTVGNVATFGSGSELVVVSMNANGDEEAYSMASSVGFYINHMGEVVSVRNDAKARDWAWNAGSVYYVNENGYYMTLDRGMIDLDDTYTSGDKPSQFDVPKISTELIVRVSAIRNVGAVYFYDAAGNFVKTCFKDQVFHMTNNYHKDGIN